MKRESFVSVQKIGILTSGGDCGGLNAVIKGVAKTCHFFQIEAYIIPNGYAGLYNLCDLTELPLLSLERLDRFPVYRAGSEAGNSRVKISKIAAHHKYERIQEGLRKFNLDALVIAGGDDTGSVAVDLTEKGISCVHAPKTMDLDLMTYSVGGDSTINLIADFAKSLYTTGETHNRIIILEVFGRYAGHTAFRGGIASDADIILIPEVHADFDIVYEHSKKTLMRRIHASDNHSGVVMAIIAEGLKDSSGSELVDENSPTDSFGHRPLIGAGAYSAKQLEMRLRSDLEMQNFMKETGQFVEGIHEFPEVRQIRPTHLVRCGKTTAMDVNFGMEIGSASVHLIRKGVFGVTVCSYQKGKIAYMECKQAIQQRYVDPADIAAYEAMGVCFGRKSQTLIELQHQESKKETQEKLQSPIFPDPIFMEQKNTPWRPY